MHDIVMPPLPRDLGEQPSVPEQRNVVTFVPSLKNCLDRSLGLSNLTVCITITVLSTEIFSNEMQVIFATTKKFFREESLNV